MTAPRLALHITDRCQLDCEHCLRDPGARGQELSVEQVTHILREASAAYGTSHVTFTGGEPTLHRQFIELVDACVEHGYLWTMVSNAEKFDRLLGRLAEDPRRIAAIATLEFSLDGGTELTHDIIRGRGSFQSVQRAMALCREHGIRFRINATLQRQNRHEIEELVMLAARAQADGIFFELAQPTGTYLDPVLFIPPDEIDGMLEEIARLDQRVSVPIAVADGFPRATTMSMCESLQFGVIYVGADGQFNGCCRHAGVPGPDEDAFVLGAVETTSMHDVHRRVVDLATDFFASRAQSLGRDDREAWQRPLCNDCLRHFGRPHWRDDGTVAGASARRERWRGAWAPSEERKERVAAALAERDG